MAKQNSFPGIPAAKGGLMPKVLGTLVVLAVLTFTVKQPAEAAHLLRTVLGLGAGAVDGLAAFLTQAAG